MQKQDLEISGITTSRRGITSLIENQSILIMVDPRWLILLCTNNTLLCWKKSLMIWSLEKRPEDNCGKFMVGMDKHTGKVVVSWETKQAYSD